MGYKLQSRMFSTTSMHYEGSIGRSGQHHPKLGPLFLRDIYYSSIFSRQSKLSNYKAVMHRPAKGLSTKKRTTRFHDIGYAHAVQNTSITGIPWNTLRKGSLISIPGINVDFLSAPVALPRDLRLVGKPCNESTQPRLIIAQPARALLPHNEVNAICQAGRSELYAICQVGSGPLKDKNPFSDRRCQLLQHDYLRQP